MSSVVETCEASPMPPTPQVVSKELPTNQNVPDNYVSWTLKNQKPLPPITLATLFENVEWPTFIVLVLTPSLAIYGLFTVHMQWKTFVWSVAYYYFTGLGITAGYHRLWAHRSYNASKPLQYFLAVAGTGAVEGSIKWWCRKHRAHHRYTDTDLDPYNANKGFFFSHVGWMLVKPRHNTGAADVSDLSRSEVIQWQYRWYAWLIIGSALVLPTSVAGLGWGDWAGGFFFATAARLTFVHHSTFCVNSLAHWLGETPFDDKHSPRDHFITALVTVGEGYHNFHHQFPMDYRNAIRWYQYDPTKWFIWVCSKIGLASHLKVFPENEVRKGELTMQLKKLRKTQDALTWPPDVDELPVISWESFQEQSSKRPLIIVAGFIHDVSDFINEHPGGRHLIIKYIGKDATPAFFGGVYDHSNAAHNLLSMKRVGALHGGIQHGLQDMSIPPAQRLRITRYNELAGSPYSPSPAASDGEGILG